MKGLFFAFIIGAVAYAIFGKKLMQMFSKKDDVIDSPIEEVNNDDQN